MPAHRFFAFSALAAAASLAAPAAAAPSAASSEPFVGRCQGGTCSWSRELSRTLVRQSEAGRLLRLSLRGGSAGEEDEASAIRWNRTPHDVYVFCSTRAPAVMMRPRGAGAYQVDLLDLVNGPPGVLESSMNLYIHTCHPDMMDAGWSEVAARHGYTAPEPGTIAVRPSSAQMMWRASSSALAGQGT